jgi:hypothetical protein
MSVDLAGSVGIMKWFTRTHSHPKETFVRDESFRDFDVGDVGGQTAQ